MGEYGTKKLLDEFFKTMPESTVKKTRGQLDRKELYDFEIQKGKPLVELDALEIAEMIGTFRNQSFKSKKYKMSNKSYDTILSMLRAFFDWYIYNHKVIINPCNDKRIRGRAGIELLREDAEAFTSESVEDIITKVRENAKAEEYADYYEAMLRLYFEGIPDAAGIISIKESDVDTEKGIIKAQGRDIPASDRLIELLVKVHEKRDMPAYRGQYVMVSHKGSYFKFPTRPKNADQEHDNLFYINYLNRVYHNEVRSGLKLSISARMIYLCGFYNYMVQYYGQKHANEILESVRDSEATRELEKVARAYGVVEKNPTTLKKSMQMFITK